MSSPAKFIVITGVSRGLGAALAAKFIELGHTVSGCARSAKAVEALSRRHGEPHRFDVVDVASDPEASKWASSVIDSHGAPDFLLNNAAVINANAPLWEVSDAEFSRVIDINIKGVANVIRHFVPAMIARKTGVIVNFSSGWGRSTDAQVAPYCATKWAIEGLTMALAQELPAGLAAIPLNPGVINTEMLQSCFGESASAHPTADEWAEVAAPFILKMSARDSGRQLTVPV